MNCVLPHPLSPDQLFVCDRSSTLYVTTLQGQVGGLWGFRGAC